MTTARGKPQETRLSIPVQQEGHISRSETQAVLPTRTRRADSCRADTSRPLSCQHAEGTAGGLVTPGTPLPSCDCFQLPPQRAGAPACCHRMLPKGLVPSGASRHRAQLAALQKAPPTRLLASFRLLVQQKWLDLLPAIKSAELRTCQ